MLKNKWFQTILFMFISVIIHVIVIIATNIDPHTVLLQSGDAMFLSGEWIYGVVYRSTYAFQFFLIGRALGIFKFEYE